MKLVVVAGARPNFMKIAPLMDVFRRTNGFEPFLVHTGQHYDERMSDLFFRQLGIPEPDVHLGVGSGSHATQTATVMTAFEPVVLEQAPDAVLVVGDVNSTIACGLVAVKLGVPLVHVEAGLRSFDRTMPEEINRVLTDAISDVLLCSEPSGVENLHREGAEHRRVHLVGNVMIDTLLKNRARSDASDILSQLNIPAGGYAVLTLHRPANVDDPAVLGRIFDALDVIQQDVPVIFPAHPRTAGTLRAAPLADRLEAMENLRIIEPVGYLDFLKLMADAKVVLTDSGGIQEETTILGVPCLTMRENTERPITIERGTNQLVGTDPERILAGWKTARQDTVKAADAPPLWDGKAAERIADVLKEAIPTKKNES